MIDERTYGYAVLVLCLCAMSVSIFYRSRAASRQPKSNRAPSGGPLFILMRLTFVFGLLAFIITYVVSPEWTRWASMRLPDAVRIGGGLLALGMIPCFIWLFRHLRNNVTPTARTLDNHKLVVTGPYRWVRHPMYSAGILFWFGLSLLSAKWLLLVVVGLVIAFLIVRTPREEQNLVERFGDAYRDYMVRTGRYFPKLFA